MQFVKFADSSNILKNGEKIYANPSPIARNIGIFIDYDNKIVSWEMILMLTLDIPYSFTEKIAKF